jgi:glycosyltransferase involved in cell wall biosynthesis
MRVLHVPPTYAPAASFGGPIESTHQLCKELARAGCEVRVLTTDHCGRGDHNPYPRDRWVLHDGIPVRYCSSWGKAVSTSFLAALPRIVRRADIVHVTGIFSFTVIPSICAAMLSGKPVVVSPRGSLDPWSIAHRGWKKRPLLPFFRTLLSRAAAIHVTSATEGQGIDALGIRAPIVHVPNGARVETVLPRRADERPTWRDRLRIPAGAPMLLMLGRLHHVKGIDVAISALRLIRAVHPEATLVLAGPDEGGYARTIDTLAVQAGLRSAVRRVGLVAGEDKTALLRQANLLLLPSRQENFGNVVVEALAQGTPVVASRATPWELLETERCGRWVELDPGAIAGAVSDLLSSEERATTMGAGGRALVAARFGWPAIGRRMAEIYRACVAGQEPAGVEAAAENG